MYLLDEPQQEIVTVILQWMLWLSLVGEDLKVKLTSAHVYVEWQLNRLH